MCSCRDPEAGCGRPEHRSGVLSRSRPAALPPPGSARRATPPGAPCSSPMRSRRGSGAQRPVSASMRCRRRSGLASARRSIAGATPAGCAAGAGFPPAGGGRLRQRTGCRRPPPRLRSQPVRVHATSFRASPPLPGPRYAPTVQPLQGSTQVSCDVHACVRRSNLRGHPAVGKLAREAYYRCNRRIARDRPTLLERRSPVGPARQPLPRPPGAVRPWPPQGAQVTR